MKYLKFTLYVLIAVIISSCGSGGGSAPQIDLTGFTQTDVPGSNAIKAEKRDANGILLEQGILINGRRNGSWVTFHENKENVLKTSANYVDDQLNGLFLTYSNRGQIETQINYVNGIYEGDYFKYEYGRLVEASQYRNGEMEGIYRKFYSNNKLQIEAEYSAGKLNGLYVYYDDKGNVVMEYQYKDGEKVGGGVTGEN